MDLCITSKRSVSRKEIYGFAGAGLSGLANDLNSEVTEIFQFQSLPHGQISVRIPEITCKLEDRA